MDWNTWLPPLLATGVGLAAGLTLVWQAKGSEGPAEEAHALRAHKASLMERLRELEVERPKLEPATYETERTALVEQAAAALRQLEALETRGAARPPGLMVPIGVVAAITIASIGVLAWPDSSDSVAPVSLDAPPARSRTTAGAGAMGGGMGAPSSMAEATAMAGSLPSDLAELNTMAYNAILGGELPIAMGAIEKARSIAPDDPLVNTHLNIMRMHMGMTGKAASGLEALVQAHPQQPRPLLWLAYVRGQQGQDAEARGMLERVLDMAPDSDEAVLARQWMMEIDSQAAQ